MYPNELTFFGYPLPVMCDWAPFGKIGRFVWGRSLSPIWAEEGGQCLGRRIRLQVLPVIERMRTLSKPGEWVTGLNGSRFRNPLTFSAFPREGIPETFVEVSSDLE